MYWRKKNDARNISKDIAHLQTLTKAIINKAKDEAKEIISEAESRAEVIHSEANSRAEREVEKIAREVVASARQTNQKEVLIARRKALDTTHDAVKEQLAILGLGRASMLKSMMAKAGKMAGADYIVRPVEIDRKALDGLSGKRN